MYSKIGLLSAYNTHPKKIIGITSNNDSQTLLMYGAHITIDNYCDLTIEKLLQETNNKTHFNLEKHIYNSISSKINVKNIVIDKSFLKGGYICDIYVNIYAIIYVTYI